jgi:hypothetical protein
MKLLNSSFAPVRSHRVCTVLLAAIVLASVGYAQTFTSGEKGKVKGAIKSRNGDLIKVQDDKTASMAVVKITDDTKIVRDKSKVSFHRHEDINVTAMVPGLTISAEGVGNADNQLEASKISFSPDAFAIEVAQQQKIKTAAGDAQSTANQGVTAAGAAQSSANQAQTTAKQAGSMAQAAGDVAVMNAANVQMVNKRISDLNDYKTVVEAAIYYPAGQYTLDGAAKGILTNLPLLPSRPMAI